MPESEESLDPSRPDPPVRKRVRRRRRRPVLLRYWWLLPVAALLAFVPLLWSWLSNPHFTHEPLKGYISDVAKLETEYLEFTGKPLDPATTRDFEEANRYMLAGNYANAALILESTAKQI